MTRRASTVCLNTKSNTGGRRGDLPANTAGTLSVVRVLARLVLDMLLFVLNGRFENDRYIYDLNVLSKGRLSLSTFG